MINASSQNNVSQRLLTAFRAELEQHDANNSEHEVPSLTAQATTHNDTFNQAATEGATINFNVIMEERGERAIDRVTLLTMLQNCLQRENPDAIMNALVMELSTSLSAASSNLEAANRRIEAQNEENRQLNEKNQTLKAELERRPPLIEKIDRASSPIIPEKRGKYLGTVSPSFQRNQSLLSSDGKWIVVAHIYAGGSFSLFTTADLNEYEQYFAFGEQEASPIVLDYTEARHYSYFISPDNKYLVSSTFKGDIVWELAKPDEPCFVLEKSKDVGHELLSAVSSDGKWLAYRVDDEFKLIERAGNSQNILTLQGNKKRISPVFLSNGEWVASAGEITVHLYSLKDQNDKEIQLEFKEGETIIGLSCSSDGQSLAVKSVINYLKVHYAVRLYNVDEILKKGTKAPYFEFSREDGYYGGRNDLVFSEDGKWLAYTDSVKNCIHIWFNDNKSCKRIISIPYKSLGLKLFSGAEIAWQQRGNHLALILGNQYSVWQLPLYPAETAIQFQAPQGSPQSTADKADAEASSPFSSATTALQAPPQSISSTNDKNQALRHFLQSFMTLKASGKLNKQALKVKQEPEAALIAEREIQRPKLASVHQEKRTPEKLNKFVGKLGFDSINHERYLSPNGQWIIVVNKKEAGDISLFSTSNLELLGKLTFGDQADSSVIQAYRDARRRSFFISPDSRYFVSSSQKGDLIWELSQFDKTPIVLARAKDSAYSNGFLKAISSNGQWRLYDAGATSYLVNATEDSRLVRTLPKVGKAIFLNSQWLALTKEDTLYLCSLQDHDKAAIELKIAPDSSSDVRVSSLVTSLDGQYLAVNCRCFANGEEYERALLWRGDEIIQKGAQASPIQFSNDKDIETILVFSEDSKRLVYRIPIYVSFRIGRLESDGCKRVTTIPSTSLDYIPLFPDAIAWHQTNNQQSLTIFDPKALSVWQVPLSLPEVGVPDID